MKHFEDTHKDHFAGSALTVNSGVDTQPVVSPYFVRRQKASLTALEAVEGILSGDITILARAITLVESALPEHQAIAQEIITRCMPHATRSVRIGITGVPGAGKSTFIEAIGSRVVDGGRRLAVLAIDPSSERSKGSILGDKTRMEQLSHNKDVFIRPSPAAGSLGGVARKTRETMILCEAAGFDTIFIETVGVGQSEIAVHSMVDLFLMLQISGAGDELQGIKRGIMEMADMVVITKADGSNIDHAAMTKVQIEGALQLFPLPASGLRPKVYLTSATEGTGLDELWSAVQAFLLNTANFDENRAQQATYWMYETINEALSNNFYNNAKIQAAMGQYELAVHNNQTSPFLAAKALLDLY
ncbi:MAG: methylmalonyl Co-A mutase-associated GTPase MeaB, partial [Mucinivorans sp.]